MTLLRIFLPHRQFFPAKMKTEVQYARDVKMTQLILPHYRRVHLYARNREIRFLGPARFQSIFFWCPLEFSRENRMLRVYEN